MPFLLFGNPAGAGAGAGAGGTERAYYGTGQYGTGQYGAIAEGPAAEAVSASFVAEGPAVEAVADALVETPAAPSPAADAVLAAVDLGRDPYDINVRLKVLDGTWEEVGAEAVRYRGVWPENVQFTHDDWGDATCSFDLRRASGAIHPDLSAFTDCEITVCGRLAWAGRVKETPTREGADPVVNVQGEGWQYHLDDDQYGRAYVHTRLSDYRDVRGLPDADLTRHKAYGQVSTDGGAVTLMIPNATPVAVNDAVAATIDLGAEGGAIRVVADVQSANNSSTLYLYIMGHDTPYWASEGNGREDYVPGVAINAFGGRAIQSGTTPKSHRYVTLRLDNTTAVTPGADVWLRFLSVKLFADTAYESGGQSVLRADHIAVDALAQATMLLDPDRTGIQPGVFAAIPEFAMDGKRSAREAIQAANAYENYELKVDARRPVFRPRVTAPVYEVGEWSGADFEDASANSGQEILNRVFVQGTGADGQQLTVERYSGQAFREPVTSPAPTNPSFATDTAGWSISAAAGSTITRDTSVFDTAPASLRVSMTSPTASPVQVIADFAGVFRVGLSYGLDVRLRGGGSSTSATLQLGVLGLDYGTLTMPQNGISSSEWTTYTVQWVPSVNRTGVQLRILPGSTFDFNVDSLVLTQSRSTLVARHGFRRSRTLPVSNRITEASAARIGDLYLDQHRSTPFTGGFKATGMGGVRRVLGGQTVHPGWLGRDTGQLVRANHVIDPDTGGVGRDERIKSVAYDHNTLTATVSLAEDRSGFDALLSRLASVVG